MATARPSTEPARRWAFANVREQIVMVPAPARRTVAAANAAIEPAPMMQTVASSSGPMTSTASSTATDTMD